MEMSVTQKLGQSLFVSIVQLTESWHGLIRSEQLVIGWGVCCFCVQFVFFVTIIHRSSPQSVLGRLAPVPLHRSMRNRLKPY